MSGSVWDEGDYLCCCSRSLSHNPISHSGRYFPLKQTQSRCVLTSGMYTQTHSHTTTIGAVYRLINITTDDSPMPKVQNSQMWTSGL